MDSNGFTPRERIAVLRDVADELTAKAQADHDPKLHQLASQVEDSLQAAISLLTDGAEG
jgi:hypothetical protein